MRDLAILFIHLLATIAKLLCPGGGPAVVAESLLLKHQLVVLNRGRERAPNLRPIDRVIAGLCTLIIRPGRLLRAAIVLKPSTFAGVVTAADFTICRSPLEQEFATDSIREFLTPFADLVIMLPRLTGPGGARSIIVESLFVKRQLPVVNRSRQ